MNTMTNITEIRPGLRSPEDVQTRAIGALVNRAVEGNARNPAELHAVIEHVLAVAVDWHDGKLPLREVEKLTTELTRFLTLATLATTKAGRQSAGYPELRALLDALHAQAPGISRTRHGDFSEDELRQTGAKIEYDSEHRRELLVFPVRYPGVAPPVFRPRDQRGATLKGPAYGRDYGKESTTTTDVPWWDQDGDE